MENSTPEASRKKMENFVEQQDADGTEDTTSRPPAIGYYVFYFLGMATLLPWNFFITNDSYWAYKFRNSTIEASVVKLPLFNDFYAYLSVASMLPNTLFLILNAAFGHRFSQRKRMVSSMGVIIAMFAITVVLVPIISDAWQDRFMVITLMTVVVINIGCAVFQGTLFGLAAQIPGPYVSAVMSGQSLGAVFSNLCYIVALATASHDPSKMAINSALVFFILADIAVIAALASYLWIIQQPYFKFHLSNSSTQVAEPTTSQQDEPTVAYWSVLEKIRWYAAAITLVFTVTISVFPAITVTIEPYWAVGTIWATTYFRPVACFLLFNVSDFVGRSAAGLTIWPKAQQKQIIFALTVVRICFVPLFMFSNVHHSSLTTVFSSDLFYVVFMGMFGFSNGYMATLCMIYGPQMVEPSEQNAASSMMAAFLGIGLSLGAALSKPIFSLL